MSYNSNYFQYLPSVILLLNNEFDQTHQNNIRKYVFLGIQFVQNQTFVNNCQYSEVHELMVPHKRL